MRTRARRWTARLACSALVLLVVAPTLSFGTTLVFRDALPYQAPQNRILRNALTNLRLAEWDPSQYAGVPHLASPPAQALYPPRLLAVLATSDPTQATDYSACLHLLWLLAGGWVLGRQLGLRRSARAVLGLTLVLAGPTVSVLDNLPSLAGIAWLPWAFAAGLWARRGSAWRCGWVGVTLAAPVFAGAPQEALWGAALATGAVLSGVGSAKERGLRVGVTAVWSMGVSAAILLPALALAPHTTRTALELNEVGAFSFHPTRALEWILPLPWGVGFPERGRYLGRAFEPQAGELWTQSASFGLLGLVLALRAFTAGVPLRLRSLRTALLVLAGLGALLACGRHVPGFGALAASPYGVFRFPEKHLALVVLSGASLAALAVHSDRPRRVQDGWLTLGSGVAVWAAAAVAWALGPRLADQAGKAAPGFAWGQALGLTALLGAWWFALGREAGARRRWAVCGLLVLCLLPVGRRLVFTGPAALAQERPPAARVLGEQVDPFGFPERVYVDPQPFGDPPAGLPDGIAIPAVQLSTLRGASSALYGLHAVQGMTGWWPANRAELSGGGSELAESATTWWLGPSSRAPASVNRHDLPLGATLVRLEAAPRLELVGCAGRILEVRRPAPETLRVRVRTERAGSLLWRECAYPGWTVGRAGNSDAKLAGGLFLCVEVPPGVSELEFRYRTPGLRLGGVLSMLGLLVLAAVSAWNWRRQAPRGIPLEAPRAP